VDSLPLNTKEEWLSVLDLSHLFGFDRYTDLAAHRLMSLTSAMDKILLGRRFGIQGWLRSAYRELCEQAGWVSDADGFRLGLSDVLRIGRVRAEYGLGIYNEAQRRAIFDSYFPDLPVVDDDILPSRSNPISPDISSAPKCPPVMTPQTRESLKYAVEALTLTRHARDSASMALVRNQVAIDAAQRQLVSLQAKLNQGSHMKKKERKVRSQQQTLDAAVRARPTRVYELDQAEFRLEQARQGLDRLMQDVLCVGTVYGN
jgi:hypothetical protein